MASSLRFTLMMSIVSFGSLILINGLPLVQLKQLKIKIEAINYWLDVFFFKTHFCSYVFSFFKYFDQLHIIHRIHYFYLCFTYYIYVSCLIPFLSSTCFVGFLTFLWLIINKCNSIYSSTVSTADLIYMVFLSVAFKQLIKLFLIIFLWTVTNISQSQCDVNTSLALISIHLSIFST